MKRLVREACACMALPLALWGRLLLHTPSRWYKWELDRVGAQRNNESLVIGGRWRQHVCMQCNNLQHATATSTHAMPTKQTWSIYTCNILWTSKCAYIYVKIVFIVLETRRTMAETQAQFAPPGLSNIIRFQSLPCNSAVHMIHHTASIWSTTRHQLWTISPSMQARKPLKYYYLDFKQIV